MVSTNSHIFSLSLSLTGIYFLLMSRWNSLLGSRYSVVIPRLVRRPSAQRTAPCRWPVKHFGDTKLWVPLQLLYLSGTISQGIFYPLPLLPSLDHYARFCYHLRGNFNAIVNRYLYGGFVIKFCLYNPFKNDLLPLVVSDNFKSKSLFQECSQN